MGEDLAVPPDQAGPLLLKCHLDLLLPPLSKRLNRA